MNISCVINLYENQSEKSEKSQQVMFKTISQTQSDDFPESSCQFNINDVLISVP